MTCTGGVTLLLFILFFGTPTHLQLNVENENLLLSAKESYTKQNVRTNINLNKKKNKYCN